MALAGIIGKFVAIILAELAPVLVEIFREMNKNTAEDGAQQESLRDRLLKKIKQ